MSNWVRLILFEATPFFFGGGYAFLHPVATGLEEIPRLARKLDITARRTIAISFYAGAAIGIQSAAAQLGADALRAGIYERLRWSREPTPFEPLTRRISGGVAVAPGARHQVGRGVERDVAQRGMALHPLVVDVHHVVVSRDLQRALARAIVAVVAEMVAVHRIRHLVAFVPIEVARALVVRQLPVVVHLHQVAVGIPLQVVQTVGRFVPHTPRRMGLLVVAIAVVQHLAGEALLLHTQTPRRGVGHVERVAAAIVLIRLDQAVQRVVGIVVGVAAAEAAHGIGTVLYLRDVAHPVVAVLQPLQSIVLITSIPYEYSTFHPSS